MIVALPICQQRISPVLDTAARLLLVTRHRRREVRRQELVLSPLPAGDLARAVAELRVDLLLCAALSAGLYRALRKEGVRVQPHVCGEVEAVLHALSSRRLGGEEFHMPGCWGQHFRGQCLLRRRVPQRSTSWSSGPSK